MIYLRAVSLVVASTTLLCAPERASAQDVSRYSWCSTNGGGDNCYYASLERCRETTAGGRGGRCFPSPYYRPQIAAGGTHQAAAGPVTDRPAARRTRASAPPNIRVSRTAQSSASPSPPVQSIAAPDYAAVLRLAEQGDATAQYSLAVMYNNGQGVPQDYVQAHKWFNLAAARFAPWEADVGSNAAKNRDRLTAIMTAEQIADAQKMAREWQPKADR